MKQKILLLSAFVLLIACKDNSPYNPVSNPPKVVSSIPENNASSIAIQNLFINLIFDVNVTCPAAGHNKVTINDANVDKIEANFKNVNITISGLQKDKTYTLIIPKDVIFSPAKVGNEEIKISFSTEKDLNNGEITATLCVENPLSETQKVYDFLRNNFGTKIVSGTMANVSWNTNEAEWVHKHTGKYPALNCFDYVHLYASPANWIDYSNTTVVENWWNANGLVAAMWHWNVPVSEGSSTYNFYSSNNTFSATNATIEGTYENTVVKTDLEKIANYLLLLKNKNIPVIWRPLHEASGGWFWWGAKGAESFKKLWIMMFDTFKAKGLNNLIWVWTSQTNDTNWYPGDKYVDIIGCDEYNKTDLTTLKTDYNWLRQTYPNKIITLSEFGNISGVTEQWNAGIKWSWMMPWYDYDRTLNTTSSAFNETTHQFADISYWNAALTNESIITRDEMPSLK